MKAITISIFAALLFYAPAAAQEEAAPKTDEQMQAELVKRIQEGMKAIDDHLLSARTRGVKESLEENIDNIEKLLNDSRNLSSQVVSDLDELIRSIKYQKGG